MTVTDQPPRGDEARANDYHVMQHVGEFTRSISHHTASVLNGLLLAFIALVSLGLFWIVATMLGVI